MKKILLLFAQESVTMGMAHPEALASLLNKSGQGITAYPALLDDLLFFIDGKVAQVRDTDNNRDLRDYDAVYFRYWGMLQGSAIAAARYCKLTNTPFVDSEVLRVGSQNKITQYMNLYEAGVPIPRTLLGKSSLLVERFETYGFAFPLVVKAVGGTRGADNHLVRTKEELRRALATRPDVLWVLQSCVPNDRDYRVIVMGDEVKMVIERRATADTHLNNTSQGGSARIVPLRTLPQHVLELSVKAAKFFGREIAGVDIVQSLGDGTYYCFEVNRAPQIESASFAREKAELLAQYLSTL